MGGGHLKKALSTSLDTLAHQLFHRTVVADLIDDIALAHLKRLVLHRQIEGDGLAAESGYLLLAGADGHLGHRAVLQGLLGHILLSLQQPTGVLSFTGGHRHGDRATLRRFGNGGQDIPGQKHPAQIALYGYTRLCLFQNSIHGALGECDLQAGGLTVHLGRDGNDLRLAFHCILDHRFDLFFGKLHLGVAVLIHIGPRLHIHGWNVRLFRLLVKVLLGQRGFRAVNFTLAGLRVRQNLHGVHIDLVGLQNLVVVLAPQLGHGPGKGALVTHVHDTGTAPGGIVCVQVCAISPDGELPAHDLAVRHLPVRSAHAGEVVVHAVHPAGHVVVIKLAQCLIAAVTHVDGAGMVQDVLWDFGFGLVHRLHTGQVEAVGNASGVLPVVAVLSEQVGNDHAGGGTVIHSDQGRLNQIAQTQGVCVHRHRHLDPSGVVSRDGLHSGQRLVQGRDDVIFDEVLGGQSGVDIRNSLLICGHQLFPVCFAVVAFLILVKCFFQVVQGRFPVILHLRVVGGHGAGALRPLGVEHDAFPRHPGGIGIPLLALGTGRIIVPAAEGIAALGNTGHLGRIHLAEDGGGHGFQRVIFKRAALGVKGNGCVIHREVDRARAVFAIHGADAVYDAAQGGHTVGADFLAQVVGILIGVVEVGHNLIDPLLTVPLIDVAAVITVAREIVPSFARTVDKRIGDPVLVQPEESALGTICIIKVQPFQRQLRCGAAIPQVRVIIIFPCHEEQFAVGVAARHLERAGDVCGFYLVPGCTIVLVQAVGRPGVDLRVAHPVEGVELMFILFPLRPVPVVLVLPYGAAREDDHRVAGVAGLIQVVCFLIVNLLVIREAGGIHLAPGRAVVAVEKVRPAEAHPFGV
ncbi:Uncharacterised protein [Flavonifractor plautii]|uniref:Uncharacterized protein n=1 Tax=Flavonifractor plautii TaxID=292800 RepID=A0A174MXK8_FLAPL|nr:Uncharacterised protein [Flavonifractor plautii]